MRNFTFNGSKIFRLNFFIAFFLLISVSASAQFYTKHYIAPAPWQYFNDANEIVIATNSTSSVSIVVSKSDGTFITNLTAIKGTPAVYRFSGAPNTTTTKAYTFDTVLNGIGLIVTASAPVAINLRNVASDALSGTNIDKEIKGNAALTSFGDAGLGVRFRVGYYRDGSLGNFNGYGDQRPIYTIMATVDNTTIKINNTVTATLNSGQSYLFKAPIGTLVESSNPIVMNTSAAIDTPDGCGDSAYNQIPPEAVLGTEYFLERGTGNSTAEQTTVVATKDNTSVKVESFSTSGANMNATTITLANAGDSYTFVNGYNNTSFTASHVVADKRVAVYSGTAQGCEVDISTIAPVSECGGSNFIETAKFRNYNSGTLDYFGYILLRSATDVVTVNGTNIATISGIGARYQIGTSGWYIINFNSVQIGSPDVLSIASNSKMTVSIVQQAGGFSMAGFFSNFAAQPEDPTLTYISGGGCTNNTAELTTPAGFAPYQWYYNGVAITGANSATYTATKTGAYSVGSTLVCGTQTQSKPVNVTLCTDLGITKTVDNTAPCLGSNVEFTVKVSNLGGNNVSGVSVNDLLPSGYAYVGSTPSVGVYDSGTGIWTIGDVEAQTSMTLKIVATVNSSGNYTNTASLPNAIDTNTANNSASAAVTPKVANLVVTNPAAVCSPSTVDLTVPAITSGSSSNLTLSYWTNSNASTALSSPSSVSTAGTYYIKAVSSDGCTFIKPVVVTVNSPSSNNSISGATNCATGSVTLTASGGSGTYLWSTGDTSKTITVTTDGSYTVQRISSSGCVTSASAPAVVTFKPVAPTASSQTFCSSENKKVGDLVASGAALKWYNASTNGTQYAVNATLVTGTYYVSQTTNGCESLRTSVSVTVNSTSSAPVASAQSYCAADNKKISDLALTVSGSNLKWYSSNSSSTALATNTVLTSTTYYVSQTANSCGESARTAVAVTINTVPSAPTASSQTFCAIDAKKVSDLTATGSNLKWYSASTNGTLYTGSETLVTGSYYVSQTNTCGESTRRTVAVTVNNTAAPTASSQTFCAIDNKKVSDLTASGSNLKWYSASTGSTLYTGTETLSTGNYYVSQTLNSCESTRTLVSVTVNNTAAPTASAQTFCFDDNKKVSDLTASGSNLKWYSASTGGTLYAGTETLSSGNYYVSQTLNSCESTRTLVSVTVNPTPAAPTITAGGATTFCTGGSVVLTSSGGNSYLWSTGATTQSITVSASGAYSVKVGNASGCLSASSASTTVTVDVIPSAPTASAQAFCSADAKKVSDLLPSGTGIKWYSASTGGTLYAGTEVLATGTYFVSQTTNGCESTRTSVSVTVNTTPSAPAASAQTFCSADAKKVSDLLPSGTGIKWYSASTGGTLYTGTEVLATGTYFVSQTTNGCESTRTSVSVTVNTTPSAPTASGQTFCSADAKKVSDLLPSGTGIKWYSASTGGTLYAGTEVLATGTYFVSQTTNGCESTRTSVSVTVNTTPSAPAASAQTFCSADAKKVSDLLPSGTGIKWYSASTGGTLYTGTEVLATGTYFVSQTTNGCESTRTSVSVTVNTTPSAPTASGQTFCSADAKKVSDLLPSGTGIKWYSASTGGTLYAGTEVLATGTYFVSQTTSGCESARTSVSVTVNTTPSAPAASGQTFCSADAKKVSDLLPSGTGIKWYSASTGGTLYAGTEVLATGTYFVSQTTSGCESARTSVSVTVNTTPSAPAASAQTFCSADAKKVSDLLPSGTGIKWYSTSTGGTLYAGTEVLSTGTYFVSQTTNGCESTRTSVSVTVNTTPSAPTASAQTFCSADAKKVSDLLPSGTGIKWYSASTGGTLYTGTEVLATGTYFVSQTTSGCESTRTSVSVTVNTTPVKPTITANGATTLCSGESITLTSSSTTGNLWSTGETTQSITVTSSGNYNVTVTTLDCSSPVSDNTPVTVNPKPSKPVVNTVNQATCSGTTASVELSGLPAGNWTINPGNITGNTTTTTISGLLPGNTYNYTVTNSLGCESLPSSDVTILDYICAVNDTPSSVNGLTGGTISTVFVNDKVNGSSFLPADVSLTTSTLPTGVTFNSDGTITIAPNTAAGTHTITYTICKSTNLSICDSATVEVVITAPSIDAVADALTPSVNGLTGGNTTLSLINADTLNGVQAVIGTLPGNVSISGSGLPTGITINADGTVKVAPNTAAGTYNIQYSICEINNTSNCDSAVSTVVVTAPSIDAVADALTPSVNGLTGGNTTLSLINADTLNGVQAVIGTLPGNVSISGSGLPTGITINADGTVKVAPNTAAGTYNIQYSICEVSNTSNCDSAVSTVVVTAPAIDAVADALTPSVNGLTGGNTTLSLINADTLNGVQAVIGTLPGNVSISGSGLPTGITINADGTVKVAPNTAAGTYNIQYSICEINNTSNCDSAVSTVVVTAPSIDAVADALTPSVNGLTGGNTTLSLINADTLNGVQAVIGTLPGNVSISGSGLPTGITINADGTVKVAPNTAAGTYNIQYSICEVSNTSNCDSAVSTVVVTAPAIDAVADALTPSVNGLTGGNTTLSLINADTLNGVQAVIGTLPGNVSISGSGLPTGITINADGTVKVAPNTAAGTYNIQYSICEINNTSNCDSAVSTIVVTAPSIDAVADALTPSVNGLTGGNTTLSLINADTLNGVQAVIGTLPGNVSIAGSGLPTGITINTDGTVKVAPNTAAGTYNIQYSICEINNTSNCDSAVSTIVVTAPSIDAVAEALTPSVNGLTGGNTTLSLINADTLNGVQAVIGTLPGNVSIAGSGLPTGITINTDGTVKVAPNTAAGTYNIQYSICEINNTSNCDSAVSTIVVTAPSIDAVAEALTPSVNGLTGGNTTLSLINADTLNGVQAVIGTLPGNVSISGSGLPTGITINTDGTVKVAPNTAAGTYNIQYSICEINNTSNCDSAVSTIVVTAPSIDAVADALTPSVNGLTGGNTTLSLINADTLNGVQAVIGTLPGNVSIAGSGLPTGITINTDGTVKVAPNTAAGTYNIQYSICEINNTSNCDSAVSTIVVTAPSIDAVAEALTPSVNGLTGGNTTLSLINADTLNGVQAVIGTLPGNVSIAGSGLPTGITINTDGTVKVAPNTAAGTYNIQYSICEINNTSNCDSAVSTIVVTAPSIDAVAEALTPSVNGLTGGNTTLSLINADTLNGVQAVIGTLPGNVSISGSGLPTGITINADGTVKVAPNTAAGTYNIQYSICEINNTSNCDSAVSTVVVTAPSIDAVADALTPSVNGLTGGNTTLSLINADTLNGVQAVIGTLPGNVSISGSGLPTGITINADGTVKVAPNTAAGTYNIQYSICEVSNTSNCDSAVSTVVVTAPAIDAVADALTPSVNGLTGGNTTLSLINADTLNGVQAVIGTLPGNVSISGSGLPTGITINADGTVKVAPNTAAGTYNIQYSICEINNTSNCDSAVSTIVVTAPSIDAVADALTPSVNGLTGGNTTLSLINADTLNGVQAVIGTLPGNVSIAGSGLPTGITINADGTVKVAPNTAAGTYNIQYSICEVSNTSNCDSVVSTITVTAPSIDAVAEALTPSVNGLTGGNTTLSLINADTLNGVQAVIGTLPGNVSIAGSGLPTGITINTDGTVKVAPNTAAGTYNIQYSICEINNTSNCDSAVSTIVVTAPSIDAVAEALTPSVNGLTGGNTTLSLINADTLNGVQAVIGTLPGNVSIAGSGLPTGITINTDGTVKVAPNTAAGTYNIQYSICEINNTSNCDSAVSTIVVTAPSIDAVADALTPSVNGLTGGNTTLSLINADTLNGVQAVIGTLPGNVSIAGSGLPTGITINTDGTVKVAPNTAAGTYNIQYSICEINNTSNCDSAVSTIVVTAPSIDAVADALTPSVNGLTGGNTTLSLINADTLNGVQAVIGTLPGNVSIAGSGLPTGITINTDGTVKVAPNTAAGTYNIQYSICEINNTSNCDSAVSTIVVTAPSIDAVAEALTPSVNGLTGGNTTLSLINADTLNGVQAVIGTLPGNVSIAGSGLPTGITINTDGTVKVAPNTAAGTYNIQYSICEINNTSNCDSAVSTIVVTAPSIDAVAEALTPSVNGLTGGNTTLSLINADTLNGVQAVIGTLPGNVSISGSGLPTGITINADGTVKVAPNTAAGTYNIQYSICEINNTSNCDSAVSTVVVTAPSIDAVADALTPSVNGLTGGNTTLSLINADTLNGVQAVIGTLPGNVSISGSGLPTGITINADGTVKVAPNTAAGTYNIQYSICEVSNTSNCDSAVSTVVVTAPAIDAVADALTPSVNGLTGGNTTLSLINADTLNGVQAVIGTLPGNVSISGSGLPTGITINADGTVKVAPNTAAGTYNIQYSICEINNTSNCDSAVSTIVVTAPSIDAVADALTPSVNGLTGGNTTLSLINADTLNGVQAVIGTLPGNVSIAGSGLPTGITINTDGTVKVAPNTAAGTYNIQYSICEINNTSNCDSAVSTIVVTAPSIDAVAEALTPSVNGLTGGNTTLSLINADTLNGVQAVIGTLPGNVSIAGSGLPTGITINTDGTVKVAPNTAAGTYNIQYSICEINNTSNCDSAVSTIVVTAPSIDAVAEALTPSVNGLTGGNTTLSLINADTLNGVQAVIGTLPGNVSIAGSGLPTGITINTDGTVKVAPNTAAGTYNIQYSICEINNTSNCDSAVSTIVVTAPSIDAVADALTPSVNGLTGGNTTLSLINADTLNGVQAVIGTLPGNVSIAGSGLPTGITINTDGTVKVAPNTAAGTYNIQYSICEINNTSNCDSAVSTIVVTVPPVIDAVTETTAAVNSNTGGTTVSLTANDTLSGNPVTVGAGAGEVSFTLVSTLPAGLTINADQTITVAPGTLAGSYEVEYTICDNDHASNCDTVKSYITVTGDTLTANADTPLAVTQSGTAQTIINVISNDTRNGNPLTASEVTITTTTADPSGYLTLDPVTGTVSLGANAPAGTYTLTYSICDKTNTSNCSTASVTLTVNAPAATPVIDAVTETTTAVNSNAGGTTVSLTANDTLNGNPVTVGTGAGEVSFTLVSTLPAGLTINADETITVAPGTVSGSYEVEYTICDNDHASNCDTVKSYITVTGDTLTANADTPLAVTVSGTAQTIINVISNDTRNGNPLTASEVTITTTTADPSGYLTLDPVTGVVSLGANAPAGTYTLTYSICDKTNTSNCSTASVTLTVNAPAATPVIDAVTETTTAVNSNAGGATVSLTANDKLNGNPVTVGAGAGEVSFTLVSTLPAGLTINADQTITVAPGTLAGSYEVEYTICDNDHASNCDTVKSYITVTGDTLTANADTPLAVTQSGTAQTIINVISNDTRNGNPLTASEVTITTTTADPSGYLTLDPVTGVVSLGANAPAGTYTLTYSICDKTNTSNCSTASVTLTVNAPAATPVIDAVTETTTAVNSNAGGATVSLTANDKLNGNPVTVGTGAGEVSFTLVSTLPAGLTINAGQTITVAPGTLAGSYEVEYTICDNDHASNCDTVKSYITVTGDTLTANADTPSAVTQSGTAQTIINVISNDTRNGNPLTASEVTITTTTADPSGYLTLDPSTGVVSLGANAPAGTYTLTYSICDKTNTSNCSTASVTLTVNAPAATPVIDAVTETTTAVNSNAGGATVSLTANDKLNGNPVTVGTGAGEVSFTLVSTLPAGLTINAGQTITVAPGTLAGSYEVEYTICDNDHASNCDTVKSYITVTGDTLTANADTPLAVTQSGTAQTIINVISNDTRNGNPLTASEVTITTTTADPSGYLTLDPVTGTVSLGANAPAGTYTLTYSICDKTNTSNCSTASVTLTVNAPAATPVIDAVTETTTAVNSNAGGATVSLTANDKLNGNPVTVGAGAGEVSFTLVSTLPAGLTINADQTITVAPGTLAGSYEVEYTICDNDHASNCDTVKSYITVTGDTLTANADTPSAVTQSGTAQTIINVISNDTRNGNPLTASEVTITTTTADPSGYLTLDPVTGVVSLGANAPAGTYTLTYSICDKTNTSNCSTASVTLTVNAPAATPVIDAVTETTTAVNSNAGGTTVSLTANDTLSGNPVTVGARAGQVSFTLVSTLPAGLTINADQTITVAPGTLAGSYEVEYTICDNDHASNCDTVKSYITVTGDTLTANADTPLAVTQSGTAQTIINVISNDTRNGNPLTASEVTITTTTADPSGYLTLDPSTGVVSLGANAPAGTYTLTYSICDKTNTSNCSTASVTLTVNAPAATPVIDAVTETTAAVNSNTGGTTVSLTANDTLSGNPVTVGAGAGEVSFTLVSTLPAGLTINADQTITVAPGTLAGSYEVEYTICDNDHASNCDTVKSYITVTGDTLTANADTPLAVTQSGTAQTIINVISNDTRNGNPLTASEVTITTTTADPSGYLTLDPSTGVVSLGANAPAGTYTLTYSICDKTNTSNCSTASVTLTVNAPTVILPVIIAVTENLGPINGTIGGTTTSLIAGDTLNGLPAVIGSGAGQVTLSGTAPVGLTINADGTIKVDVNTPIGTYPVVYTICDNDHLSTNCATITSYVVVTGADLVLVNDTAGPIAGVNHPVNVVNVLANDTKNGLPITANDVKLSESIADPKGYLTLNPDGTVVVKENAPAGTYELTYQVCELNTSNCATATVKVEVVAPTMTVTANSYCSNNVPYVSYNVVTDNFTPNNLLTIKWIDSDNNVVLTQTDLPLSGNILWAGATIDANGKGTDWPGWILTNGQWTEGADGFEKTKPAVTMQFSLNPTVNVLVSYPAATSGCNARPTFTIKANDDVTGPIDTTKGVSTSLNIFDNDQLNALPIVPANIALTTIVPNANLILNADGSVDVKPQTPSGTYQLTYQICDLSSSSSNCSQAIVKVTVVNSVITLPNTIVATNDGVISVDGINGSLEFINVLDNDLFNGGAVNPIDVTISNTPANSHFEFNADGTVNVKPNTPAGNYALTYQICEKASGSNCATAVLNVFVEVPSIAIIKTAVFNDENGSGVANAGETITYKFTVTNTGNVPLTGVTVTDPLTGVVLSGQAINLDVNESNDSNFTAQYKITQADINRGNVSNQATVQGRSAKGVVVEDKSDDSSNSGDKPTVLELNGCVIKVFNAFSPNGDSKNTRFYIQGLECYPENTVEIYNRWGVLVFDMDHYNNEDKAFKGFSEGRATVKQSDGLPVGTYFYILKYKDSDSNPHELTGYLYVNK